MGDIIIPGRYGIDTKRFTPTHNGYQQAAETLLDEYTSGRPVNTYSHDTRRVMDYFGASDMESLRLKLGR